MAANLLSPADSDFEAGVGHWTASLTSTIAQSAAHAYTGKYSLLMTCTTGSATARSGPTGFVQPGTIPGIVPGQTYTVDFWLYTTAAGRQTRPTLLFYDAAGIDLGGGGGAPNVALTVGGWTEIKGSFVAPTGAASANVSVSIAANAGDTFYLDTVSLSLPTPVPTVATMPAVDVQIAFSLPFGTLIWWQVGSYVQSGRIHFGVQHERQQVQPSTLTLTLVNTDARWLRWNTAGPYAAANTGTGLTAGLPIRVVDTWAGVDFPMFYGYIDSLIPDYTNPMHPVVTLTASDMLAMLNTSNVFSSAYPNSVLATGPSGYWRLGEDPGSSAAVDASGSNRTATLKSIAPVVGAVTAPTFGVSGVLLADTDNAISCQSGQYLSAYDPGMTAGSGFECWFRVTGDTVGTNLVVGSGGGTAWWTICLGGPTGTGSTTPGLLQVSFYNGNTIGAANNVADGKWHHVAFYIQSGGGPVALWLYIDGVLNATTSTQPNVGCDTISFGNVGTGVTLGGGGVGTSSPANVVMDEVAVYPYPTGNLNAVTVVNHYTLGHQGYAVQTTGQRIAAVLADVGVPAGLTNIATGLSQVQGAVGTLTATPVGSYLGTVNDTENGLLFVAPTGIVTTYDRHYPLTNPRSTTSQATFEDSPTSNNWYLADQFAPAVDNLDWWTEVRAAAQPGTGTPPVPTGSVQTYRNAAANAKAGLKRNYPPLSGLLQTSDSEVLSLVQYLGTHYSTVADRVRTIALNSTTNGGANLPQMLGRGMWDRVTVISHGLVGGTAFQQDALIEGGTHTWTADEWKTVFNLSPAETQQYLVLNDPVLGKLDTARLAY